MKTLLCALTIVLIFFSTVYAAKINLPPVKHSFSQMHPGVVEGMTVREIIPPESILFIALTENRGKGSPLTREFKPDWDSDQMMQQVFASDAKPQEMMVGATELTLARYTIMTKEGALFLLEVLGDHLQNIPATAVILRGDGFGCRFDFKK